MDELRWSGDRGWLTKRASRVLLTRAPRAEVGVVFVHGWHGSAGVTWEAFPRAIRYMPDASNVDAFFVQYPTVKAAVQFSASEFAGFLKDVLLDPVNTCVNPSLPTGAPPRSGARYRRVVLVAHSMGACVVRRALLDLDRDELANAEREAIELLLFAPAHKGSSLALLVQSGLGLDWLPGAVAVGKVLTVYYTSLRDLSEGSDFLTTLLTDNEAARAERAERGELDTYLRAHVYHAQGDKVVVPNQFDRDYRMEPVLGMKHQAICKPSDEYRTPVAALQLRLS